ncbi:MAG: site-specific DNA-methyltransferase [FCB group bacterium]|nr:site-specific DNA-methyltransferase [FCB group bacterium]
MEEYKLHLGDCLDVLPTIASGSVDMILTDPPYGIGFLSNWTTHQAKIANDGFDEWLELLPLWLAEMRRVLTPQGCCCCCCGGGGGGGKTPVTALFTIEAIKHFNLIQTLVWRKFIGLGWRYRPSYENIVVLCKDKNDYNFFDETKKCSNVIEGINQEIPQNGDHPTVKPQRLMERLVHIHTQPGMTICDPFMGSGTTGVAALELGRNFIGIELDEKYFKIAQKRISQRQNRLFI